MMEKTIIICSILVALAGVSLFALAKYRQIIFKRKSTPELIQLSRESRKTYNRISGDQRDSAYGRLLLRSILSIEAELKLRYEEYESNHGI